VAQKFFAEVNLHARKFMSDEHFTVDGTLIQGKRMVWAVLVGGGVSMNWVGN
jgi:hypothetical protein